MNWKMVSTKQQAFYARSTLKRGKFGVYRTERGEGGIKIQFRPSMET